MTHSEVELSLIRVVIADVELLTKNRNWKFDSDCDVLMHSEVETEFDSSCDADVDSLTKSRN